MKTKFVRLEGPEDFSVRIDGFEDCSIVANGVEVSLSFESLYSLALQLASVIAEVEEREAEEGEATVRRAPPQLKLLVN